MPPIWWGGQADRVAIRQHVQANHSRAATRSARFWCRRDQEYLTIGMSVMYGMYVTSGSLSQPNDVLQHVARLNHTPSCTELGSWLIPTIPRLCLSSSAGAHMPQTLIGMRVAIDAHIHHPQEGILAVPRCLRFAINLAASWLTRPWRLQFICPVSREASEDPNS